MCSVHVQVWHFKANFDNKRHHNWDTFNDCSINITCINSSDYITDHFANIQQPKCLKQVRLQTWWHPAHLLKLHHNSRVWFNIKMLSYQYRQSHCGDKTVVRSSYLHNGISYTGKMTFLYWIRALDLYTQQWCHMSDAASPIIGNLSVFNSLFRWTTKKTSRIFITGPLWEEFTSHQQIPLTKCQYCGKCFHVKTLSWKHCSLNCLYCCVNKHNIPKGSITFWCYSTKLPLDFYTQDQIESTVPKSTLLCYYSRSIYYTVLTRNLFWYIPSHDYWNGNVIVIKISSVVVWRNIPKQVPR